MMWRAIEEESGASILLSSGTNVQCNLDVLGSLPHLDHSACLPLPCRVDHLLSYGLSLGCILDLAICMSRTPQSQVLAFYLHWMILQSPLQVGKGDQRRLLDLLVDVAYGNLVFLSLMERQIDYWLLSIFVLFARQRLRSQLLLGWRDFFQTLDHLWVLVAGLWVLFHTWISVEGGFLQCPNYYFLNTKEIKRSKLKENVSKPIIYLKRHRATRILLSPSYLFTQVSFSSHIYKKMANANKTQILTTKRKRRT